MMRFDRRNFLAGALSAGALSAAAGSLPAQEGGAPPAPSARADWLIDPSLFSAKLARSADGREVRIENGLVRRVFRLAPNAATVAIDNLMTGESELRAVRPEAQVTIDDNELEVGGLEGQPAENYLLPKWLDGMKTNPRAFAFERLEETGIAERFAWKRNAKWSTTELPWPPPGTGLIFHYKAGPQTPVSGVALRVHYELYDGIPLMAKWVEIENTGGVPVILNSFKAEILALVESSATKGSPLTGTTLLDMLTRLHIETDYAFGGNMQAAKDNVAVRWSTDPHYHSDQITILECAPPLGPEVEIGPNETWRSFTVFELLHDSSDAERRGLAMRRMMTTLAPWIQENPLYMHIRYAEPDKVKFAIDQCADAGFEMVMLSYGSGFNIENDSASYLEEMKDLATYAESKGIAIGGYTLLASRGGDAKDLIIDVKTGLPGGGRFGPSPCLCSEWAENYFKKVRAFLESTGMNVFLNDGSYPGDLCASTHHPGHKGYLDSQWRQWQAIIALYRWCRERGYYLKVPDWYFLNGSNKTGMGYNELDWSLPRQYQPVIERQDIYDGTWQKTPSMGWMHVPLVEYRGGGEAATVEPLHEHLAHYETRLADLLGAGVQATWRGTRLYDTAETRQVVKKWVDFYKRYRGILDSDIIHLRRPDGRDWDGILHVNPKLEIRGMAMIYNPLDEAIVREIRLPLYYTGVTGSARIRQEDGEARVYSLDRDFGALVPVHIGAQNRTWLIVT
jgi:hypothetical protein